MHIKLYMIHIESNYTHPKLETRNKWNYLAGSYDILSNNVSQNNNNYDDMINNLLNTLCISKETEDTHVYTQKKLDIKNEYNSESLTKLPSELYLPKWDKNYYSHRQKYNINHNNRKKRILSRNRKTTFSKVNNRLFRYISCHKYKCNKYFLKKKSFFMR